MEIKNRKKEDSWPTRKVNEQSSTAYTLRQQMAYRQNMLQIDKDMNKQV